VSSKKHETTAAAGVKGRGGHTSLVGTGTVVMNRYCPRAERLAVSSRVVKLTKSLRLRTLWRLSPCDTRLERLAQDLQDVAAARVLAGRIVVRRRSALMC
jgi:hypothetical protein